MKPDALNLVENCFLELDSQIEELRKICSRFVSSREGGSCVVTGISGAGKTSVLRKVCGEFDSQVDVYFIDSNSHTETQASRIYDTDMECDTPRIIVVDHFEQFAMKAKQQLLYRILDASRNHPWYIICVSSRDDCLTLLEKRVRSRLSNLRIRFEYNITKESYLNGLRKMFYLMFDNEIEGRAYVEKLLNDDRIQREVETLSQIATGFEFVKRTVVMFLCQLSALDYVEDYKSHKRLFQDCIRSMFVNEMEPILTGLNLREMCLLNCILRLTNRDRRLAFSFKQIITEYKKFAISYDKMRQVDDLILVKDLNGLCNYGILTVEAGPLQGHLDFKKVCLGVEKSEIDYAFKTLTPLPQSVQDWLSDNNVKQ